MDVGTQAEGRPHGGMDWEDTAMRTLCLCAAWPLRWARCLRGRRQPCPTAPVALLPGRTVSVTTGEGLG